MALQQRIQRIGDVVPRSVTFLREVWAELKKVHWPARNETYAGTAVVLVIVAIIALYFAFVDAVLAHFIKAILG